MADQKSKGAFYTAPPITLYPVDRPDDYSEGQKRQIAVEAALEIIRAGAMSGYSSSINNSLSQLGTIADNIQKALEVKNR